MADLVKDLFALPKDFPGMKVISSPIVYLMGCGSFNQFCCTIRSLVDPDEYCPFCAAELTRRGRRPIAVSGGWQLIENEFPNPSASRMLLITPRAHLTDPAALTSADWVAIGKLFAYCGTELGIKSGGIAFRFGDPRLHAGSIAHLHANVIEPVCGKEFRVPLAKNTTDHAKNYARLLGYREVLRELGGRKWLFSSEGVAATQPKLEQNGGSD